MKLSVSILGIKDEKAKIEQIEQTKVDYLHLDVMDGHFVSNTTDMMGIYSKPLDVHLMVCDVMKYVNIYEKLKPTYITFHIESVNNPLEIINYLHKKNIKASISICPETNVDTLIPYLDVVDMVLVMSVHPGRGGQGFMMEVLPKIESLYNIREKNNYHYKIEVDGGVNKDTIKYLDKVDIAVVGSYITSASDYNSRILTLENE